MKVQPEVPATLDEALDALERGMDGREREDFIERGADGLHHSLGRMIRNQWRLWEDGTPLREWFRREHGLGHADDMSGIVIESLVRRVRRQPIELPRQVEVYKRHWTERGVDALTQAEQHPPAPDPFPEPASTGRRTAAVFVFVLVVAFCIGWVGFIAYVIVDTVRSGK